MDMMPVHGRTDHRDPAGVGSRGEDGRRTRDQRISSAPFYKWRAKLASM
jgi:hypothetical protein